MLKLKKDKDGSYYIQDGKDNPAILFVGTRNECGCYFEIVCCDLDINPRLLEQWIRENSEKINSFENDSDILFYALPKFAKVMRDSRDKRKVIRDKLMKIPGIRDFLS